MASDGRVVGRAMVIGAVLLVSTAVPGVALSVEVGTDATGAQLEETTSAVEETTSTVVETAETVPVVTEDVDAVAPTETQVPSTTDEVTTEASGAADEVASTAATTVADATKPAQVSDASATTTDGGSGSTRSSADGGTETGTGTRSQADSGTQPASGPLSSGGAIEATQGRGSSPRQIAGFSSTHEVASRVVFAQSQKEPTEQEIDDLLGLGDELEGTQVLSARISAEEDPVPASPSRLAITGVNLIVFVMVGLAMIATGSRSIRLRPAV